jgi:6-phosphogluconolactonase
MPKHKLGRRNVLRMAAAPVLPMVATARAQAKSFFVYWGTYTEGGGQFGNGDSKRIYVSRMDAGTGKLTAPELAAESPNPSWLALHPNRRYLYAVNERMGNDGKVLPGELSAFSIDPKRPG